MHIYGINSIPTTSYSKTTQKRASNVNSNKFSNPVFKGYESTMTKLLRKGNVTELFEFKIMFDNLVEEAFKSATSLHAGYRDILSSKNETIGSKLKYVKDNFKSRDSVVASINGENILVFDSGLVRFKTTRNCGEDGCIEFSLDNDLDYVIERPYDLTKFYRNGNPKQITKYSTDYRSNVTTYYNKDGSEKFWRNLLGL